MVLGVGVDIVEVARIQKALEGSKKLEQRVFTQQERDYCNERKNLYQHFSGRFAAKEAALKALGTGWQQGIRWQDVAVVVGELGKPEIVFTAKARERFEALGAKRAFLSITHAHDYAVAMVVIED